MIFDLIAGMSAGGGASIWTPAELFQNGELGFWYDSSDLSTLFQDSAEGTPVTASGQPIGLWKNKIAGNPGTFKYAQNTTSRKPLLDVISGKSRIVFDGVDDRLTATAATTPTPTSVGAGIGIGFEVASLNADLSIYNWSSTSLKCNKIDTKATSTLFSTSMLSSNVISIGSPNSYVVSGGTSQALNSVLNTILTTGSLINDTSSGVSIGATVFPFTNTVAGVKVSQFIFINRPLTATERGQLETFIRSKQ